MIDTKKNKSQYSINTPYEVEELRDKFVQEGKLEDFKKTYSYSYPEIKNTNTGNFWDDKFDSPENLTDQDGMTREKIDFLISLLPKKKVKILDLGIGQGYVEQRLKQRGINHEIYGIDISENSIRRSAENFKGNFLVGDILKINKFYKKDFFDVVIAIEVIEHVSPKDTLNLFKQINSLLKKNGNFIISTPINEGLEKININPSAHVRAYTIPILKAEFEVSGFRIKTIKTFYAFKSFYEIKKILARIFRNRWQPNNVVILGRKI
ncbi:MAG TPA: class I SAM-dependent methyltransferase [Patescibacteria group bacterium]|nr:class I SAM-dependent methyltransferase [Patescibacteria group bacterium]